MVTQVKKNPACVSYIQNVEWIHSGMILCRLLFSFALSCWDLVFCFVDHEYRLLRWILSVTQAQIIQYQPKSLWYFHLQL